ncbi:MAG TPA: DUF1028 domain-containing protein, partial [Acidobacteriota bacterium]|nr:DUF1028 domain-containing protein [Acidobacteriota bacterium]
MSRLEIIQVDILILSLVAFLQASGNGQRSVEVDTRSHAEVSKATSHRAIWDAVATFSILGFDPATGEIGGAVQSRVFSVGNGVLWAEANVGAAATQAVVDVS